MIIPAKWCIDFDAETYVIRLFITNMIIYVKVYVFSECFLFWVFFPVSNFYGLSSFIVRFWYCLLLSCLSLWWRMDKNFLSYCNKTEKFSYAHCRTTRIQPYLMPEMSAKRLSQAQIAEKRLRATGSYFIFFGLQTWWCTSKWASFNVYSTPS